MANVIDSLVVTLALDNKNFSAGIKKTTEELNKFRKENEKGLKDLNETSKKGFNSLEKEISKLPSALYKTTVALGGFMLAVAGIKNIKNFVSGVMDADSRIELLSKNLMQSATAMDAWGRATELAGGSSADLQNTFRMLSKSQTEMRVTGTTGILQYMRALGVDMVDVNRRARPVNDMLVDMAKAIDRLRLNRADAYNIFKMMGIDEGTATALSGGMKTYQEYMQAAKANGLITEKQAEASRKLEMQFISTKQKLSTLARELIVTAGPSFEKLFKMFSSWLEKLANNPQAVEKFFGKISHLIDDLTLAIDTLFKRLGMSGGIADVASGMFGDTKANERVQDRVTNDFNPTGKPTFMGKVAKTFRDIGDIVGWGESRGDYEAYNSGTIGGKIQHSGTMKGLTGMTLGQILASSNLPASDPNRIFAAGKYQMTSPFIRDAMKKMGLDTGARFTRSLQDEMFEKMLPKAVINYLNTGKGIQEAGVSLAQMYRSVADPRTGKTYGDFGASANSASISAGNIQNMLMQLRASQMSGETALNTTSSNSTTSIGQVNVYADKVDGESIKNIQYTSTSNNASVTPATGGLR